MADCAYTIEDFKTAYAGVFRYYTIPEYDSEKSYSMGDKVSYLAKPAYEWGEYTSLKDENSDVPNTIESWVYSKIDPKFLKDSEIEEAMAEAMAVCPIGGIGDCKEWKMVIGLLTAHFAITDWKARNNGLNESGSQGIITGRVVGKMSMTSALNPYITANPTWAPLLSTYWGSKAVFLLSRHQVGNVLVAHGSFTDY